MYILYVIFNCVTNPSMIEKYRILLKKEQNKSCTSILQFFALKFSFHHVHQRQISIQLLFLYAEILD